jgi:hypothetical protein
VLLNNHNTQLERDRANRKRQEAHARTRTQRMETDEKIQVVQDEIQQLTQTNKGLATRKKELQEIKKNLQESAGLKRSPRKKTGSRGKARLPDVENLQASDNDTDVMQAPSDVPTTITANNPPHFASQFGNEVMNVPPIASGLQTPFLSPFAATQSFTLASSSTWLQSPPRGLSSPISYRNQYFLPPPSISPPRRNHDSISLSAELDPTHLMNNSYDLDSDFDLTPYM